MRSVIALLLWLVTFLPFVQPGFAQDTDPPECGVDMVLEMPTLLRNGERYCLSEKTIGCRTGAFNEGLVLVPGADGRNQADAAVPMQRKVKAYGGFEKRATIVVENNAGNSYNNSSARISIGEGGVLQGSPSDIETGYLFVNYESPNNVDAITEPVWIGRIELEIEARNIESNLEVGDKSVSNSISYGLVSLKSISETADFLSKVSDDWSRGKLLATKTVSLLGGRGTSIPWEDLGRVGAWVEARRQGWEEETTSELTLRSVANGIGGFANGVESIGNRFISSHDDYSVASTPLVVRLRVDPEVCSPSSPTLPPPGEGPGGRRPIDPPPNHGYEIPDPAPDYLSRKCLAGENFGFDPPDPKLIVHRFDKDNNCKLSNDELNQALEEWTQEEISQDQLNVITKAWASTPE